MNSYSSCEHVEQKRHGATICTVLDAAVLAFHFCETVHLRAQSSRTMKTVYLAAVASNLGMLSCGVFFGWPSPSMPLLVQEDSPVQITMQEAAWVASLLTIGGAIGAGSCPFLVNTIGRKGTMLSSAIPAVIGWLMIAFASSAWELFIGRFFCGLSNGSGYVATMMYIGEISPANIRGRLGSSLTVAAKLGVFVEWVIGPLLSFRDLALVSVAFPVVFFLTLVWLPESPYHLIRRGKHLQAMASLSQLRGSRDVSTEMDVIEMSVKMDMANDSGLWELVSVSGNRKALIVLLGLVIFQQWSGSMAVLYYAEIIFNETDNSFEGKYVTMILGAVQVVCTIVGASTVDHYGRRPMLLISTFGVAVATMLVGVFFYLQDSGADVSNIVWLPATGCCLYFIMYAVGLAALPFTLMSELFPTNVKALGSTISMVCCNLCAFIVGVSYQAIAEYYGIYTAFWTFTACSLLAVCFMYCTVPETKGKTLQEVQQQLHG